MKVSKLDWVMSRAGWLVVVICALTLSAYSLFWVGRMYGLPVPLAAIVSASFDGAAIVCADLALRYARTNGDSGLGPRMGVILLAGLSSYLNAQHAILNHDPFAARILYAMPPITAVLLFEFHSRYERRGALRRAGRIAESLPVFGRWAWILFPLRTLRVLKKIIAYRLQRAETSLVHPGSAPAEAVRSTDTASPSVIRTWALQQGLKVSERGRVPGEIATAYTHAMSNGHSGGTS